MSNVIEINADTGEIIERPLTEKEINDLADLQKEAAQIKLKQAEKVKQQAAILAKLGLTEEEAKVLLG